MNQMNQKKFLIWHLSWKVYQGCWNSCSWCVIAPTALTDFTPLDSDKGTVASQFDKGDVESAGLVKFDFLGQKLLR